MIENRIISQSNQIKSTTETDQTKSINNRYLTKKSTRKIHEMIGECSFVVWFQFVNWSIDKIVQVIKDISLNYLIIANY